MTNNVLTNRKYDTEPQDQEAHMHDVMVKPIVARAVTQLSRVAVLGDEFYHSGEGFGD